MSDHQDIIDEDDIDVQALLKEEEGSAGNERPALLQGLTYRFEVPDGQEGQARVFFTINERDGKLYEVFIHSKSAAVIGRLNAQMISISRQLQVGIDARDIADDLMGVIDPKTAHFYKQRYLNSLEARLGAVIVDHLENGGLTKLTPICQAQVLKFRK